MTGSWHPRWLSLVAAGLLGLSPCGCYTRVTNPKESFPYTDPNGQLIPSKSATAIWAPAYNRVLMEKGVTSFEYLLQPGTRVSVEVFGQGISKTVNIRPDGKLDLPLIGDVVAAGRSISQLKDEVSTRYAEFFLTAPQVILNTETTDLGDSVQGGDVSVINPTGQQGVVNLTGDEHLSQILAAIGALHPKSEWNEIAVIREGRQTKERYLILCDVERLVRYGDLEQDILMRNGDVVFVPFEKNTLLEEFFATFKVLGNLAQDLDSITRYIERIEGY
ncbi:MAG: polysaccharide biosynthesis/export family protein [Planctomycetota bacterium]